jgi:hypothetical protein
MTCVESEPVAGRPGDRDTRSWKLAEENAIPAAVLAPSLLLAAVLIAHDGLLRYGFRRTAAVLVVTTVVETREAVGTWSSHRPG